MARLEGIEPPNLRIRSPLLYPIELQAQPYKDFITFFAFRQLFNVYKKWRNVSRKVLSFSSEFPWKKREITFLPALLSASRSPNA